ncbi:MULTISPECIES: outer membrane protein assembly factor BamB family protein [Isoptericola]|uniref:outer membrane protein assembly factor BamB family protein n=1 Tax=Isoptericola TaxID=254250 RepID=UPI000F647CCE|nr:MULTISPECIES: PQQ-binding-like beta-propeller repeat protein [Isoptericola]
MPDDGAEAAGSPAAGPAAPAPSDPPAAVGAGPAVPSSPGPGALSRAGRRWRGLSRGVRLGAVVVAATLVATAVVVDGVLDRGRSAELRAAAGGVVDLSVPPTEAWRLDDAEAGVQMPGGLVAVAGGVAAVHRSDELLGIDMLTGQRRWTVDLVDRAAACGPGLAFWAETVELTPTAQVVCVGEAVSGEVMVTTVDPDGTVLGRRAVAEDHDVVVPGPQGTVLTATWVGEARAVDVQLRGNPMTDLTVVGTIDDGYDLEVRATDAVTGAERWSEVVPFGEVIDSTQCVRWNTGGRTVELDRRGDVDHMVSGRLVGFSGCGVLAYFTPDGQRLDLTGLEDAEGEVVRRVRPLADGGYAVSAGPWGQASWEFQVLGADGRHRFDLEGRLLDPLATDGRPDGQRLVTGRGETRAVGPEGATTWSVRLAATRYLARAGGTAVVLDERDRVVGLDLATGEVLWVREDLFEAYAALSDGPDGQVQSVFTDGRVVALVVPTYTDTGVVSRWRAIDAITGEDLWSTDLPEDGWGVDVAVDGHLLRWWPLGLAGFTTS